MRDWLACPKRCDWLDCGIRRLLSLPLMMKSVSRMDSNDMDSASIIVKAREVPLLVAFLTARAELTQMLFLLAPVDAPPVALGEHLAFCLAWSA